MLHQRHILVVDDDPEIGELLQDYLSQHSLRVSVAKNGIEMWRVVRDARVDLVILDVMLPGEDGVSLCKKLRSEFDMPILMLSAAGTEADRVVGLEVGADDYMPKPFGPRELLARVKALLRRSNGALANKSKKIAPLQTIDFAHWQLDRNQRRLISSDNVATPLSTGEYELLLVFLENPGRVLSRDLLMDYTRGKTVQNFDRAIDVQIGRLRKKIEIDARHPEIIVTERGGGYRFAAKILEE
jgi:two-component system, OmpR family, response regulator